MRCQLKPKPLRIIYISLCTMSLGHCVTNCIKDCSALCNKLLLPLIDNYPYPGVPLGLFGSSMFYRRCMELPLSSRNTTPCRTGIRYSVLKRKKTLCNRSNKLSHFSLSLKMRQFEATIPAKISIM